jgi:hypothetical protein
MYNNQPVLLPQVSNREDLLISVSIFDDDTGNPVDLDGCTTASGNAFTAAAWTVTDGTISTTSATSFTIPALPIGNQLSALNIVVGAGLGILQGDPIKIADTLTGLNFVLGTVTSYTPTNGQLVVQVGNTFQFEIRKGAPRNDGSGYLPWYDFGTPDQEGPLLSASLGNGVMITDLGYLQILIPESKFRQLNPTTYSAALTIFDGVNTRQVFLANLPVLYGNVTQ